MYNRSILFESIFPVDANWPDDTFFRGNEISVDGFAQLRGINPSLPFSSIPLQAEILEILKEAEILEVGLRGNTVLSHLFRQN